MSIKKVKYKLIGLMSGTSLDGLDIAFCTFSFSAGKWDFSIDAAETIPYSVQWKSRLASIHNASALDLALTHVDYGHLLGKLSRKFIRKHKVEPDFISSHGHTIFHQPSMGLTLQIGHGAAIAAETGIPVISDFRAMDVALGGQGAPLVPIGDMLLFSGYDLCLNLGGIANISFTEKGKRLAYDICPVNQVLNRLAAELKMEYDKDGKLACSGKVNESLLKKLNSLPFFIQKPPKSLGREWISDVVFPLLSGFSIPVKDKLSTFCEHIAMQIALSTAKKPEGRMLVTGGGALNKFLVNRIKDHVKHRIVIPDPVIINFKEALVFAFLGVLRYREETNCLSSVTGASHDNTGGMIFLP
jgi:anhydro-N-acetylmuramic acid kinase